MRGMQRTDRLEASRLRALLNDLIDVVICIDERGGILDCNPAVEGLLGWTPDELVGKDVGVLAAGPHGEGHGAYMLRAMTTGERAIVGSVRRVHALHRTGVQIPVSLSVTETHHDGHTLFTGVLRDARRELAHEEELAASRQQLEELALQDGLTGVLNRRALLERAAIELARAEREGGDVAVIMLDLDHFKAVNDTHGHLAGDAVLREAVARVQTAVRVYDLVGRYGGEEFLVVAPGAGPAEALAVAERIRGAIAERPVVWEGSEIAITTSIGVVSVASGEDLFQAIGRADAALYKAKDAGRNCVVEGVEK